MKNVILFFAFLFTSTLSFAGNTPFVTCTNEIGNVIDSFQLEMTKDRYGREIVQATLTFIDNSKDIYTAVMPSKK